MIRYFVKRLLLMILVVFGVLIIAFILNEITPGDAATHLAGDGATEEQVEEIRERLGLNEPVVVRFVDYVWGIVSRGDLGTSYTTRQPVLDEIMDYFPTTFQLTIYSFLFSVIVGVAVGALSAAKQNSAVDNISMAVSMLGVSLPQFWLGLMLILAFSVHLRWFSASGIESWKDWILPSFTLGIVGAAQIARTTRSAMLDSIRQDFVRTARAKGQTNFKVITRHVLRNAQIPIITVMGIQLGTTLGGAVVIEQVFSVPGLGRYIVDAIKSVNAPVVQGGVVFLAVVFSFINLLVDYVYALVDPRIKAQYGFRQRKRRIKAVKGGAENG